MRPLQKVANKNNEIYLSFDDGPCPQTTPLVLDVLKKLNAKATFFIVGDKALKHKDIVQRIIEEGHALGDHSSDHRYYHFFRSQRHLADWVSSSWDQLKDSFLVEPVGFRSPAGVETPPLSRALKQLDIPWVHWKHRFYDTQFLFSESRFHKKLRRISEGDIILLHDAQREAYREKFLDSLELFVQQLKDKGFDFQPLSIEKMKHGYR
ncbi:MAG: polysaccharide deacetylase family protein [Bdellovibrionales bacterium]|nr:polysaccharide deacetylase family protein [Bdellovibrionales bacterium]NQZ18228.1 polysaccharide deacetylase family protein [Bdellovibrionales bacterium]